MVLVVVFNVVGHLGHAADAIGRPELDQYDLAAQLGERDFLARERGQCHVWRRRGAGADEPSRQTTHNNQDNQSNYFFHWIGITCTLPAGGASPLIGLEPLTGVSPSGVVGLALLPPMRAASSRRFASSGVMI